MLLITFLSILCITVQEETAGRDAQKEKTVEKDQKLSQEDIYLHLFHQQRLAHKDAIKTILTLDSFEKQHKMIGIVLEKLFKVLIDAKTTLTVLGFIPGDPFPSNNDTIRDALSNIAENTAFFGDLILRLPDITHNIFDRKKDWNILLGWSIGFCNSTGLFHGNDAQLLHLMAQELNFIERDADYVNPYSEKYTKLMRDIQQKKSSEIKKQKTKKKKKKKETKKGPKLSSPGRVEL
ncbi:coiled-coil domain-containing protein 134-like [Lineus longissimus]|uniref:coiled-coil domain-containing protein 134-like n=1 Tax=Lineus longissimus TaxID=88925 RepID=UPI00315DB558